MQKKYIGLLLGAAAGSIDVIPMFIQNLPWSANLSAFTFWIVTGFLIATSRLEMAAPFKGICIGFMVLLPVGILIAAQDPMSLIPITVMTLILGSLLGFLIEKIAKNS